MRDPKEPSPLTGAVAEQEMRRLTRRGLVTGAVAALAGLGVWRWLWTTTAEDGVPWPLRRVLRFNQGVAEAAYSSGRLAPTFADDSITGPPRTNGLIGLSGEVNPADWQLRVRHEGRADEQTFGLRDLRQLPAADLVTELKCVEGWSEVMHFGGVRLIDFVTRFGLGTRSGRAPRPGGQPSGPVPLRLPDHAGRGVLCRPRHGQRPPPADAAVRHDEPAAADRPARGAAAALPRGEIRLQEPQAHCPDPLPGRTPPRLLGRARLRLVRRVVNPKRPSHLGNPGQLYSPRGTLQRFAIRPGRGRPEGCSACSQTRPRRCGQSLNRERNKR